MAWGKGARRAIAGWLVASASAGICLSAPAAADTLVVRASGPSARTHPVGSKLSGSGSIILKAGDVVTLLDARGTRTLRGPGSFSVAPTASAAPASNVMLSALLDTKRVRRVRTGAVRGTIGTAKPVTAASRRPNLWLADIAQSGALCVADPASVRLWRVDPAQPTDVRISGRDGQAVVRFGAGEAIAPWPTTLPVAHGAAYRIEAGTTSNMSFALLGAAPDGLEATAAALIAHDCTAQVDLLADAAERPGN